jgi:hypothetical protein
MRAAGDAVRREDEIQCPRSQRYGGACDVSVSAL